MEISPVKQGSAQKKRDEEMYGKKEEMKTMAMAGYRVVGGQTNGTGAKYAG
jgi:hypothetical protein